MKMLRPVLVSVAVVTALVVILVALAFAPPVQTWLVRRTLAAQPGMRTDIGRVAIGWNSIDLSDVRVHREGFLLTLPSAEIRLPVLAALGDEYLIESIVARGWTLDLTAAAPGSTDDAAPTPAASAGYLAFLSAAAAQQPAPAPADTFRGVLDALDLPFALEIGAADLAGEIIFPTQPAQPAGRAEVNLTGGGLRAGQEGRFTVSSDVHMEGPAAPVTEVTARSELTARMRDPRSFDALQVVSNASASGPQVPNGARLNIDVSAARDQSGERYSAALSSAVKTLAQAEGSLAPDTAGITGSWRLDAQSSDLAPFALGRMLPIFAAQGNGGFVLDDALSEVQLAGQLDGNVDRLDALQPELRVLGAVAFGAEFDLRANTEEMRVSRLVATFSRDQPLARIEALQGFEFNPRSGALRVASPADDLFRVSLQAIPPEWLQIVQPDLVITGQPISGEWVAQAREGRFSIRTTAPLEANGLTVSGPGRTWVEDVSLSLTGSADYSPAGWQAELSDVTLTSGDSALLSLSARAGRAGGAEQPLKATGQYEVQLAGVAGQPLAAEYGFLTAGSASGSFNVSLDGRLGIGATLELTDMEAAGQILPQFKAELRSERHPDGRVELHLPIAVISESRTSDLTVAGLLTPAEDAWGVKAELTSDLLYVEDLELLMTLIPADEDAAEAEGAAEPVWAGLNGEVSLGLKRVVYSPAVSVSNVAGTFKIGPDALTLANIGASMGDGGILKLDGGVNFEATPSPSYGLAADLTLSNFNPAPIFNALNPGEAPVLEGHFDVASRLQGRAADFAGLIAATEGDMKLTSRGGVLRALSVDIAEYARAGSRLAGLAGVIGLATGDNSTLRYAERLRAATELATKLAEFTFDQLTVQVERSSDQQYLIRDLSIISPTIRLLGAGSIQHQPGQPIWVQPLTLSLQVAARDEFAAHLRTLRLAGGEPDPLGYVPLASEIVLDGSLSAIGASELRDLLVRALNGS